MRRALVCATVLALAGAASAAAALPRPGALVAGTSLAGVRLGEPAAQVRAALGGFYGVCRGCAGRRGTSRTARSTSTGLGVELTRGRVSAVYTLWQTGRLARPEGARPRRLGGRGQRAAGPAPADRVPGLRGTRPRRGGRAHRVLRPRRQALGLRSPPRAGEPLPVIELADVQAAARRLDGVANRTPVVTLPHARRPRRRGGPRRRRSASSAAARSSSAAPTTRSPRCRRHARRNGVVAYSSGNHAQAVAIAAAAARHDGDDPHAGGRAAREGRRDARLRRGDRPYDR